MDMFQLSPELKQKLTGLTSLLSGLPGVCVAFSGGVDSTVLAYASVQAFRERLVSNPDLCLAITAESPSMPLNDKPRIADLARQIGITHRFVPTFEMLDPMFTANTSQRCYYCKRHILTELKKSLGPNTVQVLVEGSNADDIHDRRPGFQAVQEFGVLSPLLQTGLTKSEIRILARYWKLPNAERPASPCLCTRITTGTNITIERLRQIDQAEMFLKALGLKPLRVRLHNDAQNGNIARIQTAEPWIDEITRNPLRKLVLDKLKTIGFDDVCVDLDPLKR